MWLWKNPKLYKRVWIVIINMNWWCSLSLKSFPTSVHCKCLKVMTNAIAKFSTQIMISSTYIKKHLCFSEKWLIPVIRQQEVYKVSLKHPLVIGKESNYQRLLDHIKRIRRQPEWAPTSQRWNNLTSVKTKSIWSEPHQVCLISWY